MDDVTYQIHWLSVTIFAEREDAFTLYSNLFEDTFGKLQELGCGGRSFKEIFHNALEFKIYMSPKNISMREYWNIEIPGRACECISNNHFLALGDYLESNFKNRYKFVRLDFALDHVPFTPEEAYKEIDEGRVRSLAKRETLKLTSSSKKPRDNGVMGTSTTELGANTSTRMVTIYNKRGDTRFEFQMREDRADIVAKQLLLSKDDSEWFRISISHIRDFIDFRTDWWNQFVNGNARAELTLSKPRDISMNKLMHWINKQVSPALSVATDILPKEEMDKIVETGRKRRGSQYDLLLNGQNLE